MRGAECERGANAAPAVDVAGGFAVGDGGTSVQVSSFATVTGPDGSVQVAEGWRGSSAQAELGAVPLRSEVPEGWRCDAATLGYRSTRHGATLTPGGGVGRWLAMLAGRLVRPGVFGEYLSPELVTAGSVAWWSSPGDAAKAVDAWAAFVADIPGSWSLWATGGNGGASPLLMAREGVGEGAARVGRDGVRGAEWWASAPGAWKGVRFFVDARRACDACGVAGLMPRWLPDGPDARRLVDDAGATVARVARLGPYGAGAWGARVLGEPLRVHGRATRRTWRDERAAMREASLAYLERGRR